MSLTVRESLGLEPLKSARVLAGAASLDRAILSASIIEVPDVWKWLHGGEMLLTTLYPFRDDIDDQLNLIRQLASKRIACLVVKLHRFVDSLSPELIDLAEKEELPVLDLPADVSFIDVLDAVWRRVWDRRLDTMEESESLVREALNMVAEGKGIQALVSFIAQTLRNPVSFHDPDGNLVAVTCDRSAEQVLRAAEEIDARALASLAETSRTVLEMGALGATGGRSSGLCERPAEPVLVVRAETSGRRYGYLAVWESAKLRPSALRLVDSFALAAAVEMAREQAARDVELRHLAQFLREILSGAVSEEVAAQQARALGVRIAGPNLVLSIGCSNQFPGDVREDKSAEVVVREVSLKHNPFAIAATVGKYVIVLWPLQDGALLESRTVKELLEPWRRYLLARMPCPFLIGVGRPAQSFADIPDAYRTSRECCMLLERLNGPRAEWLFFDDLGIMRIVGMCPERDVDTFVNEVAGPLLKQDDGSRSLEETLYAYLEHNGNLRETARSLYIHTNTLRYRLNKISSILNLDLGKMSNRVTLWTALTISRFRRFGKDSGST